jgi:hypothetical protein
VETDILIVGNVINFFYLHLYLLTASPGEATQNLIRYPQRQSGAFAHSAHYKFVLNKFALISLSNVKYWTFLGVVVDGRPWPRLEHFLSQS